MDALMVFTIIENKEITGQVEYKRGERFIWLRLSLTLSMCLDWKATVVCPKRRNDRRSRSRGGIPTALVPNQCETDPSFFLYILVVTRKLIPRVSRQPCADISIRLRLHA
jgi:hypothetical protein